jgi:hypothetical protein
MKTQLGVCFLGFLVSVQAMPGATNARRGDFWVQKEPFRAHAGASFVFTGTDVIVWGAPVWFEGELNEHGEGGVYNVASGTWRPTSMSDAPAWRYYHTAVWSGRDMIVWGGVGNGPDKRGSRYDPRTDRWTWMSANGSPIDRWNHTAVWTGTEMIVWGGQSIIGGQWAYGLADGGRYDPATDTWKPLPPCPLQGRFDHTAVWTGSEMIVFGGHYIQFLRPAGVNAEWRWTTFADGAAYNPRTDSWRLISSAGNAGPRTQHTAVWSGTEMLVWGGGVLEGEAICCLSVSERPTIGARYNSRTDSWKAMSDVGAPEGRVFHTTAWTGREMIVWGGHWDLYGPFLNGGGRYDPRRDTWRTLPLDGGPEDGFVFNQARTGVWTGDAMFIHGATYGYGDLGFSRVSYTYLYYPPKPPPHHGLNKQSRAGLDRKKLPRRTSRFMQGPLVRP